jgi:hypothetical protein
MSVAAASAAAAAGLAAAAAITVAITAYCWNAALSAVRSQVSSPPPAMPNACTT